MKNDEDYKKALMKYSKETIVNLFLSANWKAERYDTLVQLLKEMLEDSS